MFQLKLFRLGRPETLHNQIDAYLTWKSEVTPTTAIHEAPSLQRFARFVDVGEVSEIEVRHIKDYEKYLKDKYTTQYAEELALRAVRGFLRYYHARGHICPSAKAVGKALQELD